MIRKPVISFPSTGEDGCRIFSLSILEHRAPQPPVPLAPDIVLQALGPLCLKEILWECKKWRNRAIFLQRKDLHVRRLDKQGKKILSSSCFSFQLTLITVLWWKGSFIFAFLIKLFIFLICFPKYKKEQTDPLSCYPCDTAFEPVSLEFRSVTCWEHEEGKEQSNALSPLEGIAQPQLTETMLRQQGVAGESHEYLCTKH